MTQDFTAELQWFTQVLDLRFKLYFNTGETPYGHIEELLPPNLSGSPYAQLIEEHQFGFAERIALALCLTPHLRPQLLDVFFTKNKTFDRPFTEFGGQVDNPHAGFMPTGETLLFIIAGADLERRLEAAQLFGPDHPLLRHRILELGEAKKGQLRPSGQLRFSPESIARYIYGKKYQPGFGSSFPARRLQTSLDWSDLVLPATTLRQLEEIQLWTQYGDQLLNDWGMRKKIRPGYRCLFYGPPGTGKTMTANLLGKTTGREVYRIDLSMVISKYIGETEKNLSKVFQKAERSDWILFFDEADALFGKRTEVQDAHDRYANQEVSYLLQRIEDFSGITILASNLRKNLDDAFTRRFESMIYFPMPQAAQRLRIWQQGFPPVEKASLEEGLDLQRIAQQYELSGGSIMNVVRFASLRAVADGAVIQQRDVLEGIRREYGKEGKTV